MAPKGSTGSYRRGLGGQCQNTVISRYCDNLVASTFLRCTIQSDQDPSLSLSLSFLLFPSLHVYKPAHTHTNTDRRGGGERERDIPKITTQPWCTYTHTVHSGRNSNNNNNTSAATTHHHKLTVYPSINQFIHSFIHSFVHPPIHQFSPRDYAHPPHRRMRMGLSPSNRSRPFSPAHSVAPSFLS